MQITVNEPGTRNTMKFEGQNVYVVVGGGFASLMMAGRIVEERAAEDMTILDAQAWAVSYRDNLATIEEAVNDDAVYASAAVQVHAYADELLVKAEALEAHGDAPYTFRNSTGRKVTFKASDPRHPVRRAVSIRKEAARLAAWTAADESAYGRYVDNGTGATDGWYAPLDRAAWAATFRKTV